MAWRGEDEIANRRASNFRPLASPVVTIDSDLPVVRSVRRVLDSRDLSREQLQHGVLEAIGDTLGWLTGTVWLLDREFNVLRPGAIWRARVHRATAFEALTRTMTFEKGVGLPGQVWKDGKARWTTEVARESNFPRLVAAHAEGFHGALAFPLLNDGVVGVIDFFTDELRSPISSLLEVFDVIGHEVGKALDTSDEGERRGPVDAT